MGEPDEVAVGIHVPAFTLPVILVAWSIDRPFAHPPVSSESVDVVDVDVQNAGHVVRGVIALREVHSQIPEMGKA
jgi:hypothetical protein